MKLDLSFLLDFDLDKEVDLNVYLYLAPVLALGLVLELVLVLGLLFGTRPRSDSWSDAETGDGVVAARVTCVEASAGTGPKLGFELGYFLGHIMSPRSDPGLEV